MATGQSGNSYGSWSSKAAPTSSAYYAGHNAGGSSSIQLRSNKTDSTYNSGIVSTTSGGIILSVTVTWNNSTADDRVLNVYGKNTAYETPNDLYDNSTKGTLLGTIVKGQSTSLEVSGSYLYVGICSASGAMYLSDVTFEYKGEETAVNLSNYIMFTDTENQCETKFSVANGYFESLSNDEKTVFLTSDDYVISTAAERFRAWAAHQGKQIVLEDSNWVIKDIKAIPLFGNIENGNETALIAIVAILSGGIVLSYFFLKKRKYNQN